MRSLVLFTAITSVAVIASISGANAQPARGLHKHDKSIANYGYNIPIVTGGESGAANLKVDLDEGHVPTAPANLGIQSPTGAVMGAPVATKTITPIALGTQAPDFTLPSFAGSTVALKDLTARGPVLVLFTPGTSTTNGLLPLQLFQKNLQQFQTLGITVVAVTPEPLNVIQMNQGRNNFAFHILNDQNNDVSRQYGVLQGYEPVPSLFSVDAAGKIVGIQTQQQLNGVFDLKQATDPLRGQTQAAIPAPATAATQLPVTKNSPIGQVSADPDLAAPVSDAVPADMSAPIAPGSTMTPVIPAVPSPQTNKDVPPPSVPKVSYDVPPSNPDYQKITPKTDMAI